MRSFKIPPRHILPLMIAMGFLIIGVRTDHAWTTLSDGSLFAATTPVFASTEGKADAPKPTAPAAASPTPAKTEEKKASTKSDAPSGPAAAKETSSPESDLYKQLSGRRDQLDKRAQELDEREALTLVAEQRIDKRSRRWKRSARSCKPCSAKPARRSKHNLKIWSKFMRL
jgi:hypothetical protein